MIKISLHLSLSLFVIFSSCNDKKIAFNNPSWELLRFHDCHYADLIFHYYVLILKFRSVFAICNLRSSRFMGKLFAGWVADDKRFNVSLRTAQQLD